MPGMPEALLSVRGISKRFGGARALDEVSIDFYPGEVHALLGENGAGKSTLVKVIAGVIEADAGEVIVSGSGGSDVAMVFQELSVIPQLSVRDNLALSLRDVGGWVVQPRRFESRLVEALEAAGLARMPLDTPVEALPLAQRQLLEIARGLVADARMLILDEPTATLSDVEIARVHGVVRSLIARGHGVIYITHRLGEVFRLADRATVMRGGRVVANGRTSEFTMATLVTHMLGQEHNSAPAASIKLEATDEPVTTVEVRGLGSTGHFIDVDFVARAGEVTALFGQIGSGADDVVKSLVGLARTTSGVILLNGKELERLTRPKSQRLGIAYVSADRVKDGVFLSGSVTRNISSGALRRVSRLGVLSFSAERRLAVETSKLVSFDPSRIGSPAGALSGGNQQKISIARALATQPKVLVLNEPTRGVDIGARTEIYKALRSLASRNVAVVVYSSDIVELRELADTVQTMFRGRTVNRHRMADVEDSRILSEILHGAAA